MIWYYILMGSTLVFIGVLVHVFKAYFLISGYNMYTEEEKEKVDIKALGRLFGLYGYSNGAVFILSALMESLGYSVPMWPSLVFLVITTIILIVRSQKYDHSRKDSNGKTTKKGKKERNLTIGILGATVIFVGGIFFFSLSSPNIVINERGIEIKGIYGELYPWSTITNITLKEEMPEISLRTNGSSLAGQHKGYFKTKDGERVLLFLDEDIPAYIYMTVDEKLTIINIKSEEETQVLFEKMKEYQ